MNGEKDKYRYENFDGNSKALMRYEKSFKPAAYQILKQSELQQEKQKNDMQQWSNELLRKNKSDIVLNTNIIKLDTQETAQNYMDFVNQNIYKKKELKYDYDDWYKSQIVRTKPPETKENLSDGQRLFFDRYGKNLQRQITDINRPPYPSQYYDSNFKQINSVQPMIAINDQIRKNDIQSQQKYQLHVPHIEKLPIKGSIHFDNSIKYKKRQQKQYEEMMYMNRDTQNFKRDELIKQELLKKQNWFKFYVQSIQNVYCLYPNIIKFKFRVAQNKQKPIFVKESLEYELDKEVDDFRFQTPAKNRVTEIINVYNNYYLYIYMYDDKEKLIAWSMHEIYNAVNSLNRGYYKIPLYHPSYSPDDLLAEAIPIDEKFSLIIQVQGYGLKYDNPNIQLQNIHEKIQQKISGKYRTQDNNVDSKVTKLFATSNEKKLFTAQEQDKFAVNRLIAQMRVQGNSNSAVQQRQQQQLQQLKYQKQQKENEQQQSKQYQFGQLYKSKQEKEEAKRRHEELLKQLDDDDDIYKNKNLTHNIGSEAEKKTTKFGEIEYEDINDDKNDILIENQEQNNNNNDYKKNDINDFKYL